MSDQANSVGMSFIVVLRGRPAVMHPWITLRNPGGSDVVRIINMEFDKFRTELPGEKMKIKIRSDCKDFMLNKRDIYKWLDYSNPYYSTPVGSKRYRKNSHVG